MEDLTGRLVYGNQQSLVVLRGKVLQFFHQHVSSARIKTGSGLLKTGNELLCLIELDTFFPTLIEHCLKPAAGRFLVLLVFINIIHCELYPFKDIRFLTFFRELKKLNHDINTCTSDVFYQMLT